MQLRYTYLNSNLNKFSEERKICDDGDNVICRGSFAPPLLKTTPLPELLTRGASYVARLGVAGEPGPAEGVSPPAALCWEIGGTRGGPEEEDVIFRTTSIFFDIFLVNMITNLL